MAFAVVTDSVADFSPEECDEYDINVVALSVEVGDERFKDQLDISSDEFYDKMIAADDLPKSSQPSPSEFIGMFESLAEDGNDEVIAIHLAAPLSGTIESSNLAASEVDVPVDVLDSCSASAGQGLLVLGAARMRDEGASASEAVEYLERIRPYTRFFIACGTLDNLLKNGRLSASEVEGATMLNIKPMLTCDETGVLRAIDKGKGMNGVIKKYVEKLAELTEAEGIQRVRFCHSRDEKHVEKLRRAIEDAGIEYIDCGTCLCGSIVATHLGVGAVGMGTQPASLDFLEE